MSMDDINIFAKNENELVTQIQKIRIYNQDLGMEFSIEKCAMLIMKNVKRETIEGIRMSNEESIRTFE